MEDYSNQIQVEPLRFWALYQVKNYKPTEDKDDIKQLGEKISY